MIKSIVVKRKKKAVEFVSRFQAYHMDTEIPNLNIISISGTGDKDCQFKNANKVLYLREVNSPSDIKLSEVETFMDSLNGDSVLVHCEMGQVRSRWLAERIALTREYEIKPLTTCVYRSHR